MSLGLALSGGGAKGVAHLGVIAALKDNGINIDYISGTSSGSVIAAMYGAGYTPNEILSIIMHNTKNKGIIDYDKGAGMKLMKVIFTKQFYLSGFIKGDRLERLIEKYLLQKNVKDISDITIPIAIPTVNIKTGEIVYYLNKQRDETRVVELQKQCNDVDLKSYNQLSEKTFDEGIHYDDRPEFRYCGSLSEIIRASTSFPAIFRPKRIENELYVDGGVRVNTPVKILKEMGADFVIAISFDCNGVDKRAIRNVVGITSQALDILMHESSESEQKYANINARICAKNVSLLDFSKSVYLTKKGYDIINYNIDYIKGKIRNAENK